MQRYFIYMADIDGGVGFLAAKNIEVRILKYGGVNERVASITVRINSTYCKAKRLGLHNDTNIYCLTFIFS